MIRHCDHSKPTVFQLLNTGDRLGWEDICSSFRLGNRGDDNDSSFAYYQWLYRHTAGQKLDSFRWMTRTWW